MRHEVISKRVSGLTVKIQVDLWVSSLDKPVYNIGVWIRPKNKKKFIDAHESDYFFRSLKTDEARERHILEAQLKYVTLEDIQRAKQELWEKFKP